MRDAEERYKDGLDLTSAWLIEARLLARHLEDRPAAKEIIGRLLDLNQPDRRSEVLAIANTILGIERGNLVPKDT